MLNSTAEIPEKEIEQLEHDFIERYYTSSTHRNPMKTLFRLYRRYYKKLLASVIFYIIKVSPALFLPIAVANIVDVLTVSRDHAAEVIVVNAAVATVLLLLNIPFHMLYMKYCCKATRAVEAGLRGAIVRKLQQLSIRFNKEMESGRIQSKIIRDVESINTLSMQLMSGGLDIVVNLGTILFVILMKGHWQILTFFALAAPVATLTVRFFNGRIKENNHEFRVEMEHTSARVADMVEMIPVTRAHGLGDEETNRMTSQVSRLAGIGFRLDRVNSMLGSVGWVVMQLFRLLCLIYTVILALHGIFTVGDVTLYQGYFSTLIGFINTIINMIPIITKGSESINSIGEILDAHDTEDNRGKKKISSLRGAFDFEEVKFGYDADHPVLKGLNLHVKAGETIAVVGESGAGKSTILNLVTGFYMPTGGRILVDGTDISKIDLTSYRKHIAVVPQISTMFAGTIRDNITYGSPEVSEEKLQQIVEAACLKPVIDELPEGLDTPVGEHGGRLSGGQKQRISIARALIRDPRIIILDEATSALDTVSEKHIQTAIKNLAKGRTTFIVAHRLSTVKDADRIVVLKDGVCAECGTYEELLEKKGEFYKFRMMQV